ncbi:MAG: SDR family oxidoreductase, partial [Deltaproteobacteria bacterium]|nr:SDR family oxidoreductase [Deltaproteobacteria bacterium]
MAIDYGLRDKVAIVTGSGRGIGRAIALSLAGCGVKVVLAARSKDELDEVSDQIRKDGGEATAIVTDLMVNEQIAGLVEASMKAYGRIDILINNAARSFYRPLMELREDGWDKIFNVNCKAVFLLSRAAARTMAQQGGGSIINITSISAARGGSGMGAYHASKAALSMLTKCMAVEWAPLNVNVNAVGPGLTKTIFSQNIWSNPELEKPITSRVPKGRIAEPDEMTGVVLFLCSKDS